MSGLALGASGFLLLSAALLRADPVASAAAPEPRAVSSAAESGLPAAAPSPVLSPELAARLDKVDQRLDGLDQGLRSLAQRSRDLDRGLRSQQSGLSRAAATLDGAVAALASETRDQARLQTFLLKGLGERLDALELRAQKLAEAQAEAGVGAAEERARRKGLAEDVAALQSGLSDAGAELARQSRQLKAAQASLERLDSMDELLDMVQRDVEANDEELVEAKQALKRLEVPPDQGPGWWHALVTYKYLPVVAAGLAVVALGVEAFQH